MDTKAEIREFLTSRRARITPDEAGLPVYGEHRRVPGLRREGVALLAGVSVDYYTRLERGNLGGVSESEPRRDSWRLFPLRGSSDDQVHEVFPGGPRAGYPAA